jgi:hypothetical protein
LVDALVRVARVNGMIKGGQLLTNSQLQELRNSPDFETCNAPMIAGYRGSDLRPHFSAFESLPANDRATVRDVSAGIIPEAVISLDKVLLHFEHYPGGGYKLRRFPGRPRLNGSNDPEPSNNRNPLCSENCMTAPRSSGILVKVFIVAGTLLGSAARVLTNNREKR